MYWNIVTCQESILPNLYFFLFFRFLLLSLAILKYRQNFLKLQTLKLTNEKREKMLVLRRKKFGRIDSWFQVEKLCRLLVATIPGKVCKIHVKTRKNEEILLLQAQNMQMSQHFFPSRLSFQFKNNFYFQKKSSKLNMAYQSRK